MINTRNRLIVPLLAVVLVIVALVVAVVAGHHDGERSVAVADSSRAVTVQLADMRIVPSRITVPDGTRLVLDVTDVDDMRHDLYIDGGPRTPLLTHGQHATLDLGTVTHTVQGWCTVPGHKAAGMTMTITVTGPATTPGMASPRVPDPATTIDPTAAQGTFLAH